MTTLKTLLQDADPLRRESLPGDAARQRLRLTVTRALAGRTVKPSAALSRRALMAGMAMAVVMFGYVVLSRQEAPVLAAVRFEVRLAEDQPLGGLTAALLDGSTRLLNLHPEAVVNNDDVAQSWVFADGTVFGVGVELTASGAQRMLQATTGHVGRPVAILLDGTVVMAPVVRSPIAGSAVITADFTQAEAQRIADGIQR